MIYELINPSDTVTFLADDDKVAFFCALMVGNGQYGCDKFTDNGKEDGPPTMLMFAANAKQIIHDTLGVEISVFADKNAGAIADCFGSFSYCSVSERRTYDRAVECITDPGMLKKFKDEHEDGNRSSLNCIVQHAWALAEKYRNHKASPEDPKVD